MFEHYLLNKNEGATVTLKSKFLELNKGLEVMLTTAAQRERCQKSMVGPGLISSFTQHCGWP